MIKFDDSLKNNEFMFPLFVKIKPIAICNLRCLKCDFWNQRKYVDKRINKEKLLEIIDELSELNCKDLKLSGGEVTLIKELPEIIDCASKNNIPINITTNGVLLDDDLTKRLINSGLTKIAFSLDSHVPEIHDKIVNFTGAWKRTINSIKLITQHNIRITIATLINKLNFKDLSNMVELCNKLGVRRLHLINLDPSHLSDKSLELNTEDKDTLEKKVLPLVIKKSKELGIKLVSSFPFCEGLSEDELIDYISLKRPKSNVNCYIPFYHVFINYDGRITPCCNAKDIVLGDIFKDKIKDVLNNDKAKQFRLGCKKLKNKQCIDCFNADYENVVMYHLWKRNKIRDMIEGK